MENTKPTIEEQEAARLFKNVSLPAPRREILNSILNTISPAVTKNTANRIPYQEDTKGRTSILQNISDTLFMTWKKIIPVGALALLLLAAITYDKPTGPSTTGGPKKFETKIAAAGPLSNSDVDIAIDELANEIFAEEAFADEDVTLSSNDELFNLESIYQTYEL